MFVIIGVLVVLASVATGYAMAGGPFGVLFQPSEFVILGGATLGSLIISMPKKYMKPMTAGLKGLFGAPAFTDASFMELLKMLFELFSYIRKQGLLSLEKDLNDPHKSAIFSKFPTFIHNHHAVEYLTDVLSFWLSTNAKPHELDAYLETAMETHEEEHGIVPGLVQKSGDALPGFGIVAAVLGIVVTMQHLDGPPEELGHHVGAALVGTFLGILAAYGFINPMATNMEIVGKDEARYYTIIKVALLAFAEGAAPSVAVERARKVIFSVDRPSANDLNNELKKK